MTDLFVNLIEQIREATPRVFGIIDCAGTVLASSKPDFETSFEQAAEQLVESDSQNLVWNEFSFRLPEPHEAGEEFDFAVFVEGTDSHAFTVAVLGGVALHETKSHDAERLDRTLFLKSIVSDNTLLSELFTRAHGLKIPIQARRGVFIVRQTGRHKEPGAIDVVRGLFTDKQRDFVFSASNGDIVLVKEFDKNPPPEFENDGQEYEAIGRQIIEALQIELLVTAVVGIGSTAKTLRELSECYKEAQVAIDVGKVFSDTNMIMRYDNLGIGRIIYQLPNTLCEMYLSEVLRKNPIEALDRETLSTINKFFENSLNVSETARKLFVHRNTLVYRLEKIKKLTGLDLREFDNAIVFKVALMVRRYLDNQNMN